MDKRAFDSRQRSQRAVTNPTRSRRTRDGSCEMPGAAQASRRFHHHSESQVRRARSGKYLAILQPLHYQRRHQIRASTLPRIGAFDYQKCMKRKKPFAATNASIKMMEADGWTCWV